ncbi:mitochondrial export translocase Oxa2 [Akanthomyces lecanii RCEF 1005]|uniref:Mitochondrial export translocase Oxa2 n=1 Tax=Akanthomyces lecanii RCEF 1005 TaxID=1081108 RepID=A0A168F8C1_CORDF|nr:mitochondrial export translocase Oxa2 [Akanthomyces lecanii RCEF 1005]
MSHIRRPISGLLTPSLNSTRRLRLGISPPSSCRQQQRRAFINEALTPLVDSTAHVFTSIHNAGVPWYLTIPLVALGINLSVRLPMQLYMQSLDRKRSAIKPLVVAWSVRHAGRPFPGPLERKKMHVAKETEKSRKRLYKAWGVPLWKQFIPLSSMLPFVIVSEALRRLSGVSMFDSAAAAAAAGTGAGSEVVAQVSATALDSSLQTGGCLWFTDLIATDPYMGLPFLCSGLLAANLFSRMGIKQWRDTIMERPSVDTASQRLLRGLLRLTIFVPLMPLCFTYLPASVFLYWAANFAFQLVNVNFVRRVLPERKRILNWKPIEPKLISYVRRPSYDASQKK